MKKSIKRIPVIGHLAQSLYGKWFAPRKSFAGSEAYWTARYESAGSSGPGSYNKLAEFKAEVLNNFVQQKNIRTVIEYGCGDGNQLKLAVYPSYVGFEISPRAIALCENTFVGDQTKKFKLMKDYQGESAQLTLSLDVIFHLVEDQVFEEHMRRLFDSSESYAIIYSSDTEEEPAKSLPQVRRRKFTMWVAEHETAWRLLQHIPNRYPFRGDSTTGSRSDFYVYERTG